MMSVLWKKTEFYMEESNREAMAIAAGGLGGEVGGTANLPQQTNFSIMRALLSHQMFFSLFFFLFFLKGTLNREDCPVSVSGGKVQKSFGILMSLRQLNGLQWR